MLSVKDKSNLLLHNIWCGGDYNNSTLGFDKSSTYSIREYSKDYCVIGEGSIKITSNTSGQGAGVKVTIPITSDEIGKTITISCKVLSLTGDVNLQLYNSDNTWLDISTLTTLNEFTIVTLSKVIPEGTEGLYMKISSASNPIFYIDNVSAVIQ